MIKACGNSLILLALRVNDFLATGWTGDVCEINIDECASEPCLNAGVCVDGINEYHCECMTGFAGAYCERNIDDCKPTPCKNGGHCR